MQRITNFAIKKPTMSLVIILMISTLPACDKPPSKYLETLTKDKYSVVNMPNEPSKTSLEINTERKRLAITMV